MGGSKPIPLHLGEDIELTPIIGEDVEMCEEKMAKEKPAVRKKKKTKKKSLKNTTDKGKVMEQKGQVKQKIDKIEKDIKMLDANKEIGKTTNQRESVSQRTKNIHEPEDEQKMKRVAGLQKFK